LTLAILNKASALKDSANPLTICSVMSMKRKFPGYIFVEANSDHEVKQSLEGFLDVMSR
jgi:transcription antitermination factor NusG